MNTAAVDVAVVGAGPAGLTLSLALAAKGMRVLVLEAGPEPEPVTLDTTLGGWDARVSALTPASQRMLEDLGVWSAVREQRAAPYQHMWVWDAEGTGDIRFSAADIGVGTLGHIVENRVTQTALLRAIGAESRVHVVWGNGVAAIEHAADSVLVTSTSGTQWQAPLLVGADGARSRVRELVGLRTRAWSYEQQAIVATVRLAGAHNDTCYQSFLPSGPVAMLPLAEPQLCSLVWSVDNDRFDALMALSGPEFCRALTQALGGSELAVVDTGERRSFPLRQCHAVDYYRDRVVLVADAAHSIHPLAGQGVNLGFADVAVLAEEVVSAFGDDLDWGSDPVLGRYQRRRKADNLGMMAAMESFKRGFGSTNPFARIARNVGLNWVDRTSVVKHWLARQALA